MEKAEVVLEELDTLHQKMAALGERFGFDKLQSYTWGILKFYQVYADLPISDEDIERAMEKANATSVHRVQTDVKRDFQTPEQRRKAIISQEAWAEALRVKARGWDG